LLGQLTAGHIIELYVNASNGSTRSFLNCISKEMNSKCVIILKKSLRNVSVYHELSFFKNLFEEKKLFASWQMRTKIIGDLWSLENVVAFIASSPAGLPDTFKQKSKFG
jgi:hypothetical protein